MTSKNSLENQSIAIWLHSNASLWSLLQLVARGNKAFIRYDAVCHQMLKYYDWYQAGISGFHQRIPQNKQ